MPAMLYLASKSPRRRELLKQIQLEFECLDVDVPEEALSGESPEDYVSRLALDKAWAGYQQLRQPDAVVLGADTAVVIDDLILGKPRDRDDALAMLGRLSGRRHSVFSGVALLGAFGRQAAVSKTEVCFRTISEEERQWYWQTGEPADKAGAYAIQGIAAIFIESIDGSYSGVMGLPLFETAGLLAQRDITL